MSANHKPALEHFGCYNMPSTNNIAVLLVNQPHERRDVVLSTRNG